MAPRPAAYSAPAAAALSLLLSLSATAESAAAQQRGIGQSARASGVASASLGRQYALVVGTNEYEARPQWRPLVNPVRDADVVARELAGSFGFDTVVLRNPTRSELLGALRTLRGRRYGANDQVLLFVAGHGHLDPLTNSGALVHRDSRPTSEDPDLTTYTDFSRLANIAEAIPSEHVLVVLDVCYGGTFSGDIRYAGSRSGEDDPYADVAREELIRRKLKHRTRQYMTSGGREYVPDGRPGRHSPFAARLIRTLREYAAAGRVLTLAGLRANIEGLDPQPRAGPFGTDEPGSDFVFAPTTAVRTVTESQGAMAEGAGGQRLAGAPKGRGAGESTPPDSAESATAAASDVLGPSAPYAEASESERREIDVDLQWLWDDHAADRRGPLRLADTAYVVRASPPLYRRKSSGRECLLAAVIAARRGDEVLAVGWLKAGQAHNEAAQRRFERYRKHTVQRLLEKYGGALR